MYEISKAIPIPEKNNRVYSEKTKFLMSMEIGDSFECTRREACALRSYAKAAKVKLQTAIVERMAGSGAFDNYSDDVVRVWRIE